MDANILADYIEAIDLVQRTHKLTNREALTYVTHVAQADAEWLAQRADLRAQAAVAASLPLHWLRRPAIERVLEERAWTQERLADAVGISRVHFSRLLNRRYPLSKRSRRKLLDCPILRGLTADDLWASRDALDGGLLG